MKPTILHGAPDPSGTNPYYVPFWFLAMAWVGLNEKERALQALEQAFRNHEPCMVSLQVDAIFDPLQEEDRYKDLVRGVGLER